MKDSGTHKSTGLFWWSPADALGAPEITDFPPTPDNFATVPQNGSRPKHDYWLETLKARKKAQGGSTQETINALEAQAEGADAGAQPAVGEKGIVHVGGTVAAGQVAGIPGVTTVPTLETPTGGGNANAVPPLPQENGYLREQVNALHAQYQAQQQRAARLEAELENQQRANQHAGPT